MTTNPPTYIPRSGSLPDRVLDYFRQCPDEELSQADVAAKFDVSRSSVGTCLKPTVEAGQPTSYLVRLTTLGKARVWRVA